MLIDIIIGHLGADAEYHNENGHEFITFRLANSRRWTSADGQKHEDTEWVDCILNGKPAVFDYLKRSTQVCAIGSSSLRTYSSKKDRCIKAGRTITVMRVELLSSTKQTNTLPAIFDEQGVQATPTVYYHMQQPNQHYVTADGLRHFHSDENAWLIEDVQLNNPNTDENAPVF